MTPDALFELMVKHIDAWNEHDLEGLMTLFSEDCVFESSSGSDVNGGQFAGKTEVRAAFANVFETIPDAHWGGGRHHVITGDYGVSEWTLTGTTADGARLEVNGCDFLTVDRSRIVRKNSYRKQRAALNTD